MDYSLPGSSVHGIFQARILEWVFISFSRGPFRPRDQTHISCISRRFFTTGKPPRIGQYFYQKPEKTERETERERREGGKEGRRKRKEGRKKGSTSLHIVSQ